MFPIKKREWERSPEIVYLFVELFVIDPYRIVETKLRMKSTRL